MGYKRKTSHMGTGIPGASKPGSHKGAVNRADGMKSYGTKNAGKTGRKRGSSGGFAQGGSGERSGLAAGRSRTNKGKNRLGSGNPGAMRG